MDMLKGGKSSESHKGTKKKRPRKRLLNGVEVAGAVDPPPTMVAHVQGASVPVATFAPTPSSSSSLFPSPAFNIEQPNPHRQMDMQWRLQVQELITTL